MLDLFKYGELLLQLIGDIGDYMLTSVFPLNADIINGLANVLDSLGLSNAANVVSGWYYPDITVAGFLFGSGVITLLIIRLVKFFTDLVGL